MRSARSEDYRCARGASLPFWPSSCLIPVCPESKSGIANHAVFPFHPISASRIIAGHLQLSKGTPMIKTQAYAAQCATAPLAPFSFERRDPGRTTCRSRSSSAASATPTSTPARNEWGRRVYPDRARARDRRPGDRGRRRGDQVQGRRPRRRRLHGRLLPHCASCAEGLEQYCENGMTGTYNGPEQRRRAADLRRLLEPHRGRRGLRAAHPREARSRRPPRRCSARASPPIRRCATGRSGKGSRVGVVGLGGLGHMAREARRAPWARTSSLFTTSPSKERRRAGASARTTW